MPRKDLYHQVVADALEQDGWTITDDPYHLAYGGKNFYIDLGAERLLGAVKDSRKIAVEIKSFTGPSEVFQLELALGQYRLYQHLLAENDSDRSLYLAISDDVYWEIFNDPVGLLILEKEQMRLVVFDPVSERIVKWIQ